MKLPIQPLLEKWNPNRNEVDEGDLFRRHMGKLKASLDITCRLAIEEEKTSRKNYFWDAWTLFSSRRRSGRNKSRGMISCRDPRENLFSTHDFPTSDVIAVVEWIFPGRLAHAGGGEKADFTAEAINAHEG